MKLRVPRSRLRALALGAGALPPTRRLALTSGRDLRPLLSSLRESDRDRLLAALHLSAVSCLPTPERAPLATVHGTLDALACSLAVLPTALARRCFLRCHRASV